MNDLPQLADLLDAKDAEIDRLRNERDRLYAILSGIAGRRYEDGSAEDLLDSILTVAHQETADDH